MSSQRLYHISIAHSSGRFPFAVFPHTGVDGMEVGFPGMTEIRPSGDWHGWRRYFYWDSGTLFLHFDEAHYAFHPSWAMIRIIEQHGQPSEDVAPKASQPAQFAPESQPVAPRPGMEGPVAVEGNPRAYQIIPKPHRPGRKLEGEYVTVARPTCGRDLFLKALKIVADTSKTDLWVSDLGGEYLVHAEEGRSAAALTEMLSVAEAFDQGKEAFGDLGSAARR